MLVTRASNIIIVTQGNHIPYSVDILASITRISSDDEQVQWENKPNLNKDNGQSNNSLTK